LVEICARAPFWTVSRSHRIEDVMSYLNRFLAISIVPARNVSAQVPAR
jgi:hypothetical protein